MAGAVVARRAEDIEPRPVARIGPLLGQEGGERVARRLQLLDRAADRVLGHQRGRSLPQRAGAYLLPDRRDALAIVEHDVNSDPAAADRRTPLCRSLRLSETLVMGDRGGEPQDGGVVERGRHATTDKVTLRPRRGGKRVLRSTNCRCCCRPRRGARRGASPPDRRSRGGWPGAARCCAHRAPTAAGATCHHSPDHRPDCPP